MPNDTPKNESDVIASQKKMITDMGARLGPEWAAARGPERDQAVHGRNVGGLELPVLRVDQPYQARPDPHNGSPPPVQPPDTK